MTTREPEGQGLPGKPSAKLIGRRVVALGVVSSTMDVAKAEAEAGAPEGTVVLAESQSTGRGRFGRRWVSPPGANLYLSVVLRPRLEELPLLTMAASLAVARAIARTTEMRATIKWPNDVRIGGKKVSGILLESRLQGGEVRYAIVGIGINVNLDLSAAPELAGIATSLMNETGKVVSRTAVVRAVLEELDSLYASVKSGASPQAEWRALLDTLGQRIRVRWGEQTLEGLAADVDAHGNLVLERDDGSRLTVTAGEVTVDTGLRRPFLYERPSQPPRKDP